MDYTNSLILDLQGQEVIRTATKTFSYLINMNSAKVTNESNTLLILALVPV